MNLIQKYELAFRRYVFEKYPNHKAIYNVATEENYYRCVRVGTAFEEIPQGFIILFCKLEATNVELIPSSSHKLIILAASQGSLSTIWPSLIH